MRDLKMLVDQWASILSGRQRVQVLVPFGAFDCSKRSCYFRSSSFVVDHV